MPKKKKKVFFMSDVSEHSTLECLLFWNKTMKLCLKLRSKAVVTAYQGDFTVHQSQCERRLSLKGVTWAATSFSLCFQPCAYASSLGSNPSVVQSQSNSELVEPIYLSSLWVAAPSPRMGWNVWLEVMGRASVASCDRNFWLRCINCNIKLHLWS